MIDVRPTVSAPIRALLLGAAALALTACGDKGNETPAQPAAAAPAPAPSAATPAPSAAPTEPASNAADQHAADHDPATMERHHRQEMDHQAMRQGGADTGATPKPDTAPMNQSAPMKDM
jgi:hypothetical protein